MEDNTPKKSEFNDANYQIIRLHVFSMQYAQCFICDVTEVNYNRAQWILDQIWVELYSDSLDEDKGKETQDTFSHKIRVLDYKIHSSKTVTERYYNLQEKRMLLKHLQEVVCKGSKKSKRSRKVM